MRRHVPFGLSRPGMPCSSWVLFGDIFDGKVHVDSVDLDVLPEFTQRAREVRAS
jgi:hypothetical protein